MVKELKLPELGENIESAVVLSVLVKPGDTVEKDQGVIEIETDKATIEVPSSVSGTIKEVFIKEGDQIKVDQSILVIEEEKGKEEKKEVKAGTGKIEQVKEKAETEKVEKPGEEEVPKKKEAEPEEEKKEEKPAEDELWGIELPEAEGRQPPITRGAAPAAPSVRRLAREIGIDIRQVPGSGADGRISLDDVKLFARRLHERKAGEGEPGIGIKAEELPNFSKFGEVERAEMSSIRSKTAHHLSYAWASIPHVTQQDKADITELEKFRKAFNPKVEKAGGKLTVTSILLRICTAAIKQFPQFNTSIDMEKREIIYKKYFNIGIAVDTEHGLLVPVIKNADKKNLTELSVELHSLAEKARNRKISLEDLQGGCFTITNLGGIGGTYFTPIVNAPEVAILGVSRGNYEPVYNKDSGNFEPRFMLPLSLSYDHRVIDGADAARFLRWVCEAIEQPLSILM